MGEEKDQVGVGGGARNAAGETSAEAQDGPCAPDGGPCGCLVGRTLDPGRLRALDEALCGKTDQGGSLKKIAQSFGLTKSQASNHKVRCLAGGPGRALGGRSTEAVSEGMKRTETSGNTGESTRSMVAVSGKPKERNKRDAETTGNAGETSGNGGREPAQFRTFPDYRARAGAILADTREKRVAYLAKRLAQGRDAGYLTYAHLALLWGVSLSTVNQYASAAHIAYRTSLGDTSHEVNRSVAMSDKVQKMGLRVFREAMAGGEEGPDLKAAAIVLGTVQRAQATRDKATGVSLGGAVLGQMMRTPEIQALLGTILGELRRFPDAYGAVVARVREELDAKRAGGALDDAIRLLDTIDTSGEETA